MENTMSYERNSDEATGKGISAYSEKASENSALLCADDFDEDDIIRQLIAASEAKYFGVTGLCYRAAERIDFLERTLAKISDPIRAMQEEADNMGAKLNGQMAVTLAGDPEYLRKLAKDALGT
jgi:hypothetical protein